MLTKLHSSSYYANKSHAQTDRTSCKEWAKEPKQGAVCLAPQVPWLEAYAGREQKKERLRSPQPLKEKKTS